MSAETIAIATITGPLAPFALAGREAFRAGFERPRDRRKAQESLENQRNSQLAAEAQARDVAKRRAETAGTRAGRGPSQRSAFTQDIGFGSGDTPDVTRGTLFGN